MRCAHATCAHMCWAGTQLGRAYTERGTGVRTDPTRDTAAVACCVIQRAGTVRCTYGSVDIFHTPLNPAHADGRSSDSGVDQPRIARLLLEVVWGKLREVRDPGAAGELPCGLVCCDQVGVVDQETAGATTTGHSF